MTIDCPAFRSLLPQAVLLNKALTGDERSSGTIACGRALQLGERVVDHARVLDVLQRVSILGLCIGLLTECLWFFQPIQA